MRIGLSAKGNTIDEIIDQARRAEADGFTSLWFGSPIMGDPLVAMAIAGRETTTLELGTSVLQTYPCHPLLQANRAASVVNAIGRSIALGVGASNAAVVTGSYGLPYERPARNAEEYLAILAPLLRGEVVDHDGSEWTTHSGRPIEVSHPIPVLLAAMAPRLLRAAGELADGTITFLASAKALDSLVTPTITQSAEAAGRPAPRIVAGLPVAVHDDVSEVRDTVARTTGRIFDSLPNYQRILEIGGCDGTAGAAIAGDETSVKQQLQAVIDAGATDIWVSPIAVGDDPKASLQRTRDTLRELLG
jgi:F420-dependent oxidoreductase-like protein